MSGSVPAGTHVRRSEGDQRTRYCFSAPWSRTERIVSITCGGERRSCAAVVHSTSMHTAPSAFFIASAASVGLATLWPLTAMSTSPT